MNESAVNIELSARELLEVAVLLERKGVEFYRMISEMLEQSEARSFFLKLMGMELEHERKLTGMLEMTDKDAINKTPFDDSMSMREYFLKLKSLAVSKVFPEGFELFDRLENPGSLEDALELAIEVENKSTALYQRLSRFKLPADARDIVQRLIEEEESHLSEVSRIYRSLKED